MAVNTKLRVTELDFDTIKSNLKNFLKSQDKFKDYDFEGAGISVLLDILAYNSHYMAVYANMIANESFLDSSSTRGATVSLAKQLGYLPRSVSGSKAIVDITWTGLSGTYQVLNRNNLAFRSTVDGTQYTFFSKESHTAAIVGGQANFYDIEIVEGRSLQYSYLVDSSNSSQRFIIPSDNVDISTLKVVVQASNADTTQEVFSQYDDIVSVSSTDAVYFLQEMESGRYEVYFGDGVIGKEIEHGNIVILQYIETNGELANGATSFISSSNNVLVTMSTPGDASSGGADRETLREIKFKAPYSFEGQNRVVTLNDYKIRLLAEYSNIQSISVWGGEDNEPPQYGKVFISIAPKYGLFLTNNVKQSIIKNILENYGVVSVQPVLVDPDYLFIGLNSSVIYDNNTTVLLEDEMRNVVVVQILLYNSEDLSFFDNKFRLSQLIQNIDTSNDAIINSSIDVELIKEWKFGYSHILNFSNEISHTVNHSSTIGTLRSSAFRMAGQTCYLEDDDNGMVKIYYWSGSSKIYYPFNAGTIDYTTGQLILDLFDVSPPTSYTGDALKIYAKPMNSGWISPKKNQILRIREEDVSITMINENL